MAGPLKHTHIEKCKQTYHGTTISFTVEGPIGTDLEPIIDEAKKVFSFTETHCDPKKNPNQTDAFGGDSE